MQTSFRHQSEAQPPNGPLTAATSPDTPSTCPLWDMSRLQNYVPEGPSASGLSARHRALKLSM